MANDRYWAELFESIDNLSDEQFSELINSIGDEEVSIISEELNISYKAFDEGTTHYIPQYCAGGEANIFIKSSKPYHKIQIDEDCLIVPSRTSSHDLEAA